MKLLIIVFVLIAVGCISGILFSLNRKRKKEVAFVQHLLLKANELSNQVNDLIPEMDMDTYDHPIFEIQKDLKGMIDNVNRYLEQLSNIPFYKSTISPAQNIQKQLANIGKMLSIYHEIKEHWDEYENPYYILKICFGHIFYSSSTYTTKQYNSMILYGIKVLGRSPLEKKRPYSSGYSGRSHYRGSSPSTSSSGGYDSSFSWPDLD